MSHFFTHTITTQATEEKSSAFLKAKRHHLSSAAGVNSVETLAT